MADDEETQADGAFELPAERLEARRRMKQLRTEQETRRKRMEEARQREDFALREQLKLDEERLQARIQERELDQQRQKEERIARYRQERELRQQERLAFKKQQQNKGPNQVPLYKRIEEEYQKKLDEEAAARREELRKKRLAYEPIDFVKLQAEAAEREQVLQNARESRRAARLEAAREAVSVLPPLPQYYSGKTHERIVAEQHEQKHKVEIQRERAKRMQLKAQRYAKLVAELDPVKSADNRAAESKATDGKPVDSKLADGSNAIKRPQRTSPGLVHVASASHEILPTREITELQAKVSKIDAKIGTKEKMQADNERKKAPLDEQVQVTADLSSLYVDAIKHKVDLLHAIRTQRSKAG